MTDPTKNQSAIISGETNVSTSSYEVPPYFTGSSLGYGFTGGSMFAGANNVVITGGEFDAASEASFSTATNVVDRRDKTKNQNGDPSSREAKNARRLKKELKRLDAFIQIQLSAGGATEPVSESNDPDLSGSSLDAISGVASENNSVTLSEGSRRSDPPPSENSCGSLLPATQAHESEGLTQEEKGARTDVVEDS